MIRTSTVAELSRPNGARLLAHPEKDFYLAGMKSYGRAPTFLMATGYEQVRSIAAALAGDTAAADALELELPETGVCSTSLPADTADAAVSCCASSEPVPVTIGFATGPHHGQQGTSHTMTSTNHLVVRPMEHGDWSAVEAI
ncbi:hypothetical protein SB659_16235 [Arthrobacter sp. SIMBA_036]|uniref:hypothetical protein n=1 Tax=Arthrobacter sp. SIMBA_036 TaxID=3085778 RepID=UPI0039797690